MLHFLRNKHWLDLHMASICPGTDTKNLSLEEFHTGSKRFASQTPTDPGRWTLSGLHRATCGYFSDSDLLNKLIEATEHVAMSFTVRQIPNALKIIKVMGIKQAGYYGVATLKETRRLYDLIYRKTFLDVDFDTGILYFEVQIFS